MTYYAPRRTTTRRAPRFVAAGLLVVVALIVGTVGYQSLSPSSSATTTAPTIEMPRLLGPPGPLLTGHDTAAGVADGVVPDGVTVFDDEYPAVTNLDPSLLGALRRAATDGQGVDVEFDVDSGWRSAKYQEQLLDEAISKYGSQEEAARWVATPAASAHVAGDAVDIGPAKSTAWLSEHGAAYGLCQIYSNEPWHYELRPAAVGHGCPRIYADPTQDPRMQQ